MKRKRVAIIAFTEHHRQAPWQDDAWELWGLNDLTPTFLQLGGPGIFDSGRCRWFQLHRPNPDGSYHGARDPHHHQWLTQQTTMPIYMWEPHPEVKAAVPYPVFDILKYFQPWPYFNNSVSWMIALAIAEGFEEIGVYGVDMALDGITGAEYSHQRPSCEYFLGIAWGRGIRLHLPDESELLKCAYLYGFDNVMPTRRKLLARFQQLEQQDAELSAEYENIKRAMHHCRGAKVNTEWLLRNYLPGEGATQDVPRTPRSVIAVPAEPAAPEPDPVPTLSLEQSNGRKRRQPKLENRIAAALSAHTPPDTEED